jgi:hypothetical protein
VCVSGIGHFISNFPGFGERGFMQKVVIIGRIGAGFGLFVKRPLRDDILFTERGLNLEHGCYYMNLSILLPIIHPPRFRALNQASRNK